MSRNPFGVCACFSALLSIQSLCIAYYWCSFVTLHTGSTEHRTLWWDFGGPGLWWTLPAYECNVRNRDLTLADSILLGELNLGSGLLYQKLTPPFLQINIK